MVSPPSTAKAQHSIFLNLPDATPPSEIATAFVCHCSTMPTNSRVHAEDYVDGDWWVFTPPTTSSSSPHHRPFALNYRSEHDGRILLSHQIEIKDGSITYWPGSTPNNRAWMRVPAYNPDSLVAYPDGFTHVSLQTRNFLQLPGVWDVDLGLRLNRSEGW